MTDGVWRSKPIGEAVADRSAVFAGVCPLSRRFDFDALLFEPHPNRPPNLLRDGDSVPFPHFLQPIEKLFIDSERSKTFRCHRVFNIV
jgi:hypothetical protein